MNECLARPILECDNPDCAHDLLRYYPYLQSLMKGVPKWWIPEVYWLQCSLIRDVKEWQAIARARFHERDIDPQAGRDPWWGSAFMQERQAVISKVDRRGVDSMAGSDFGTFWG